MTQPNPSPVTLGENKDLAQPGSIQPSAEPTSPMLEKMARGMAEADLDAHYQPNCGPRTADERTAFIDHEWTYYLPEAKAALTALLEPTEEMVAAFPPQYTFHEHYYGTGRHAYFPAFSLGPPGARAFTAMIQAALSSAEQTAGKPLGTDQDIPPETPDPRSGEASKLKITCELGPDGEVRDLKP